MAAVIGALRVVLGIDAAALDSGLKEVSGKLASFGAGIAKVGTAAAAGLAAVGTAMAMAVKTSLEDADKIGKASTKIGVPVEQLSELRHAANLSDVSLDTLVTSLGKLGKNMSAVAGGATNEASAAFKAMGISVTNADGSLKSTGTVLGEVATKFQGYEDGAAKTALAMALFSEAGANMIPLLNGGAKGLADMAAEARQLGVVWTQETTDAAQEVNDNITRMHTVQEGIITQVTSRMAPTFKMLADVMIDAAKNSKLLDEAATALTLVLRTLLSAGVVVGAVFKQVFEVVGRVAKAVMQIARGEFSAAFDTFSGITDDLVENVSGSISTIAKIWGEGTAKTAEASADAGKKMSAPILQATGAAKNALASYLDSVTKRTASLSAEAATIGRTAYETDHLRVVLEAEAIAKANNITVTDALRQKIEGAATAYAGMAEKANFGRQVFEQTRTPLEEFQATMTALNGALERGSITWDTYARGVAQAQDKLVQANVHATNLGSALESAFDKALEGSGKLSDILKSLVVDFAKMEAKSAFKSLLYGNAGTGGTSGGLLGSIFGALRGFATGGSFQVGGTGGIDSQLVAFRASPDERVTVTKDGQSLGPAGGTTIYQIDARGADAAAVTRIEQGMAARDRQFGVGVTAVQRKTNVRRQRA